MPVSADTLRRLGALGLTIEQVAGVVEILDAEDEARRAAKREGNRERQARLRGKNNAKSQHVTRDKALSDVTGCDASPLDKKAPTPPKNYSPLENPLSPPKGGSPSPSADDLDLTEAVAIFNATAAQVGWSVVRNLNPTRRASLRARLRECGGLDGWRDAMARARGSPFLIGDNERGWRADFDFFLHAKSFTKLMEGAYDRCGRPPQSGRGQHDLAAAFDRLADHAQRMEDAQPPAPGWGRQ